MPRRLPPLNALRAFDAAGRRGSFTAAAEELGVGHAAISRHVRGLEQRLGVQLFRKLPRGLELTEAGRDYLARIAPALDAIAEATERLSGGTQGQVKLSCEPTFAMKWLVPRLGDFYARHPEVDLDLESTGRLADLATFEADLALRYVEVGSLDLPHDVVCLLPAYPVAAPSLLKGMPGLQGPADLLGLRLLHEDHGEGWLRWFKAAGLPDARLPRRAKPLESVLAIEAALAGQGVMLMSEELIAEDLRQGRLVRLSDIGLDIGGYYLVYLKERLRVSAVRAFRDWLLEATEPLRPGSG